MGHLDAMVEARRAWVSDVVRSWSGADRLDAHLRAGLEAEDARIDDADFGAGFRDAIGTGASGDALDWANRVLALEGGGWAVTGIRYRGGDRLRPFVDVVATTEPPTPDGLARVARTVVPAYAAFSPRCLRVDVPDPTALLDALRDDARFGPGSGVDMYVVAERVVTLRARPSAAAPPGLALAPAEASRMAPRVAEIYAELATSRPELVQWARPEDLESLTECAEEGLLFEILVDGAPAGVLAALRYDAHAMAGWSVQEVCVDAHHRGRHVAAGALQRLLERLPAEDDEVLWGTIHPDNRPSLRNALAVGRRIVGGYVWVTPVGLPGMAPPEGP